MFTPSSLKDFTREPSEEGYHLHDVGESSYFLMIEQNINNDKQIFGHIKKLTENLDVHRLVITAHFNASKRKAEQYTKSAAAHLNSAKEVC